MGEPLDDSPSLSLKDKQLNAAMFLKELSARMDDISSKLNILYELFDSSDGMTRGQTSVLTSLRQTIIPFVEGSAVKLKEVSSVLSPISGLNYVHNRD